MKELLVFARNDAYQVMILVPKKRGEGFLKAPIGHHDSPLNRVGYEIGYDLFGLDGSLDVQTGYIDRKTKPALLERIMTPISEHYGMPWREIDEGEFWNNHPLKDALT